MTTASKGEQILEAIRNLRAFYEDVSRLIEGAAPLMEKRGWTSGSSWASTATAENSGASYLPKLWMPHYAFRFFENDKAPDIAAFICVVMDNLDDPDKIDEPWITGGYIKYASEVTEWEWWYAKVASWAPGFAPDGKLCEFQASALPRAEEVHSVIGGAVLGLPLVEVEDVAALEEKVVEPLVKAIG